ncbi:phosphoglycerol transferase MdoB-like AlkP superfamily enzyme [Cereibacter changlensis]|uniref:Phosphoglycerol transferase MdoB-like AlkP superfamily enzyme n=2 Tax=Cereibacter changlensis TaxID=402884 RepID=A0A2W7QYT7_9RHOB|nr:sulfatase [Cereibacter changlensis]PZX53658.1 phosphoglycerol transferase MdoB-like AlkP superfamily enzyme [Cereibacter changlensis]
MRALSLLLGALVLDLVLIQPNHPGAMTLGALGFFPLELPVILLALMAVSGRGRVLRVVLVTLLVAGAVLKAADLAMFSAFGRPFDLVTDLPLILSGWELGRGALGVGLAVLAGFGGAVILGALIAALWWATGVWTGFGLRWAGAVALVFAGLAMADGLRAVQLPGAAFTTRLALERVEAVRRTLDDLARFELAAEQDPYTGREALFGRLGGRDVRIVFVESYGRASFDVPAYAETHLATLRGAEGPLLQAGLAVRSGWLTSPISGGQSWLAHGTLASGLRIDGQSRYGAMLASPRRTLFHLAREAGYRTVAVAPGITRDWPEGQRLGFGRIHAAGDLGYRGPAFDWVTVPDQFTLAAADRLMAAVEGPSLAQITLLSSHAPWVPVPRMLPWDSLGDGSGFAAQVEGGETPESVWSDTALIQDAYRRSIDYALQAVTADAARPRARPPLTIVLGDHQPAPFVAQGASRDVPVHLIGPPEVLALFDGWGWTPGFVPDADLAAWPMESFRDRFLDAVSPAAPG